MTMTKEELFQLHRQLSAEALEIMRKKNQDYTGGSADPFANFRDSVILDIEPELGLMNRMLDKFKRAKSFVALGIFAVDEGIMDIGHDLINYSVLLTGMLLERHAGGLPVVVPSQTMADPEKVVTNVIKDLDIKFVRPIWDGTRSATHHITGRRTYISSFSVSRLEEIVRDNEGHYADEIQAIASKELRKRKRSKKKNKRSVPSAIGPAEGAFK